MNKEEKSSLIKIFLDSYNFFDADLMLSVCHNNVEYRGYLNGKEYSTTNGIEEFRNFIQNSNTGHLSRKQTIKSINYKLSGEVIVNLEYEILLKDERDDSEQQKMNLKGETEFRFYENQIIKIFDTREFI